MNKLLGQGGWGSLTGFKCFLDSTVVPKHSILAVSNLNINVMRRTAYLVVNPITVNNFASHLNCTPAGLASDTMKAPAKKFESSWLVLDALCFWSGPLGFKCCSSVPVLVLLLSTHLVSSQCWKLIYMFAILMHTHWRDMKTQHLTPGPVFNEMEMVRQALKCLRC